MLWSGAGGKRKILRKSHSFLLLPVLCLSLGAGSGILFCRAGLAAVRSDLLAVTAERGGFAVALARCARYPLFLYLTAFGSLAPQLVCLTLFARGFLLSYALGCAAALGASTFFAALSSELVSGFALLPYLVLLGAWSITRRSRAPDAPSLAVGGISLGVVLLAAALDFAITPWLLGLTSSG